MKLERSLKIKAQEMAATDALSLADFLGQLIEAEHRNRIFATALETALAKIESVHGDDAASVVKTALLAGQRSVAGISLAAWH